MLNLFYYREKQLKFILTIGGQYFYFSGKLDWKVEGEAGKGLLEGVFPRNWQIKRILEFVRGGNDQTAQENLGADSYL